MKPFVKWAGGKRQILSRIKDYIKDAISEDTNQTFRYIEPFLGGGAVFFDLAPQKAIINDLNSDLINAYQVIKSNEYLTLIELLKDYKRRYDADKDGVYYDTRQLDRNPDWPNTMSSVERAARMIFLNKTCYNGLYRVNSRGEFNTPIGRYHNPLICDENTITEIHKYLSSNDIEILNASYEVAIEKATDGDIVYIDPPYDYQDDDGFTKYQMQGFTFEDFTDLKFVCDCAIDRGAIIILSNNATDKVIALFGEDPRYKIGYYPEQFNTLRSINSKGTERKTGKEVIILGMPDGIPFPQANNIEKVIDLLMMEEDDLLDKDKLLYVLNVNAERQIAYYLSALKFFGYMTHQRKFTEKANKIRKKRELIEEDIIHQLMTKKVNVIFLKAYNSYINNNNKIDMELIINDLKKSGFSESTAKRRASTVRAWIEWLISKKKYIKLYGLKTNGFDRKILIKCR